MRMSRWRMIDAGRAAVLVVVLLGASCWLPTVGSAAEYANDNAVAYLVKDTGERSPEVARWIAEKVAGEFAARGFGELLGAATSRVAGKMGGLFITFLTEMPLVGNPTMVELLLVNDGEVHEGRTTLEANSIRFTDGRSAGGSRTGGGAGFAHPPAGAVIVLTPGDCTGTPVLLRLQRLTGPFRWGTVWEQTVLTGDEVDRTGWRLGDRVVIVCERPIAVETAGTYRLVAESGCGPTNDAITLTVRG